MTYKDGSWGEKAKKRYFYRRNSEYWKKQYRKKRRQLGFLVKKKISQNKYNGKLRQMVLEKYGNKCCKCGFDDIRALQIDHINNDGYFERRKKMSYQTFMLKVLKDTENRYQLLCANCNFIKRLENKTREGVRSEKLNLC